MVVADRARARIFEAHRESPGLRPVMPYQLTTALLRVGERWSDRAGSAHIRTGHRTHSMAATTDPADHDAEVLAREVAEVLRHGRLEGRVDAVVLVAAPAFLGRLRKALDPPTMELVGGDDARDLSDLPVHELETRIPAEIWPGGAPPPRRRG